MSKDKSMNFLSWFLIGLMLGGSLMALTMAWAAQRGLFDDDNNQIEQQS